jgi:5-methylcytosine-specific restriction endonuclease McrA
VRIHHYRLNTNKKDEDVDLKYINNNDASFEEDLESNILDNIDTELYIRQIAYCRAEKECGCDSGTYGLNELDPLFNEAARLIVLHQQGSTSLIQRKFTIGYNRACRLMDWLEVFGIVGSTKGSKARDVLITNEYSLEQKLNLLCISSNNITKEIELYFNDKIEVEKLKAIKEIEEKKEAERVKLERAEKEEIKRKLLQKEKNRVLEKQCLNELIEEGLLYPEMSKRPPIPRELVDAIWRRDEGKCVYCGSSINIHIDHIIPFSKGGSTSFENLQLLCQKCNLRKSDNIG